MSCCVINGKFIAHLPQILVTARLLQLDPIRSDEWQAENYIRNSLDNLACFGEVV